MQANNFTKTIRKYRNSLILWILGLAAALIAPMLLRRVGVSIQIDNEFAALGFDTERILFMENVLITFLSAILTGLLFQRRSCAWIGSVFSFVLQYLVPFIQQAQHPGPGPDGQAQVLIPGALSSVVLTMFAVSILFAGAGAVLGVACAEVLFVPMVALTKCLFYKLMKSPLPAKIPSVIMSLFSLIGGILVVCALLLSNTGVNPLLTYGPMTNLYQAAPLAGKHSSSYSGLAPNKGTLQSGTFISPALGGIQRNYWIYLPPSYSSAQSQHYPTLYLLHGSPGGPHDWFKAAHAATTADSLIASGRMRETILIGADGNGPVYRFSEWANSFDGRQRMEDALVQDLVSFIDHHYRTLPNGANRAIGGLSMGGYGAVNIALHHPEVFHEVMSVGGYFKAEGPVFGTCCGSDTYRKFNSPSLFLQTSPGMRSAIRLTFVIGVGTKDGYYYTEGVALYRQLLLLRIKVHMFTTVGGHSWPLWAQQLGEALPLLETPPINYTYLKR